MKTLMTSLNLFHLVLAQIFLLMSLSRLDFIRKNHQDQHQVKLQEDNFK